MAGPPPLLGYLPTHTPSNVHHPPANLLHRLLHVLHLHLVYHYRYHRGGNT
jgi:hypothetical protein